MQSECVVQKDRGEESTRLCNGGVGFHSKREENAWMPGSGSERDFNVSKDFPITVSDTLHTQLTIGPTLTAAQIG